MKGVRVFHSLVGYYGKFIKNSGTIATPFTQLTSKAGFHWKSEAEEAFLEIKKALTTASVL